MDAQELAALAAAGQAAVEKTAREGRDRHGGVASDNDDGDPSFMPADAQRPQTPIAEEHSGVEAIIIIKWLEDGDFPPALLSFLYNAPYFFSPGAKVPHLPGDFGRQLQLEVDGYTPREKDARMDRLVALCLLLAGREEDRLTTSNWRNKRYTPSRWDASGMPTHVRDALRLAQGNLDTHDRHWPGHVWGEERELDAPLWKQFTQELVNMVLRSFLFIRKHAEDDTHYGAHHTELLRAQYPWPPRESSIAVEHSSMLGTLHPLYVTPVPLAKPLANTLKERATQLKERMNSGEISRKDAIGFLVHLHGSPLDIKPVRAADDEGSPEERAQKRQATLAELRDFSETSKQKLRTHTFDLTSWRRPFDH